VVLAGNIIIVLEFKVGANTYDASARRQTEDYGLDIDTTGNALLAFLDTREGANPEVTAAKISPGGKTLWGRHGVQLTKGSVHSNASPKIAGTSDGAVVVAWTSDSNTVLET
jgi:hypothetical protein